jgi:hypothetical protein
MSLPAADGNGISWIQITRAEFHVLLGRLTTDPSQVRGTENMLSDEKDVEKGPLDNCGPFNLRDCLTSYSEANKAIGIQPKHIGVTWEDLQVVVSGGKDPKVKTFS